MGKTLLRGAQIKSNGAMHQKCQCFFFALAHRVFAAFRAIWLRCSGVRASARIFAPLFPPFLPPLRPISCMTFEIRSGSMSWIVPGTPNSANERP